MASQTSKILVVNESPSMLQSVKAVLAKDGYLVRIVARSQLKNTFLAEDHTIDALESIRFVREEIPKMSQILLVSSTL